MDQKVFLHLNMRKMCTLILNKCSFQNTMILERGKSHLQTITVYFAHDAAVVSDIGFYCWGRGGDLDTVQVHMEWKC